MALSRSALFSLIAGSDALVFDRVHKFVQIDVNGWRGGESVSVLPFFDYVLVWNTGISYGLLDFLPPVALLVVMGAAMALLAIWWARTDRLFARLGLALCLGGAASNAIDRLLYGAVADFFHLHWGAYSFYVFNLADMAITLGVIFLVVDLLRPASAERV